MKLGNQTSCRSQECPFEVQPLDRLVASPSSAIRTLFYGRRRRQLSDERWQTRELLAWNSRQAISMLATCLFMLTTRVCDGQVSRLRDLSNEALTRHGSRLVRISPPRPPLPPETIVLEDGSTTFVSSLDEFLVSQTSSEAAPTLMEPEEEEESLNLGELARAGLAEVLSSGKQSREDARRLVKVGRSGNRTTARPGRNSKLAIVFAPSRPTERAEAGAESAILNFSHSQTQTAPSVLIESVHTAAPARASSQSGHQSGPSAAAGGHETAPESNKSKPIPQHWQVKSLLNVTHDYPLAYSQVICGYVWPLMAAITLFTNLMIVFVLTQHDMRTPTNVVLIAIAMADIIPIVVPVPWFIYLFAMGNEKQVLYPPVACYFYQHSTRSVSEIFYFLSTWLNVLLAIQDYLTACQPKLAKKYCRIRVVVIEIVLLTFAAFLLNLPQAFKVVFKPVKFHYNGQLTWGCKALQARWFKDLVGEYVALYDDVFTAIIVLFVDGGPAVLLITLTTLLIRQLQRRRIQGHKLMEQARTASKRRRERHRQQEYESSARVMIFVLLAFLAVKIPFATTYSLMIIQSRFGVHFVDNMLEFQKAITLIDLVFVLSYPLNFTIFCCCSKKFRHKCAQLLGECNDNSRHTRARLMSNLSGSINSSSLGNSISRRLSLASKFQAANAAGLTQRLDDADSLDLIFERKDSALAEPKKFSLAEYANNAQIPTFRNHQHHQHEHQQLDARSRASTRSSFSSAPDEQAADARRKLSQAGSESQRERAHRAPPCSGCEQQRGDQHQQQFARASNGEQFKRLLDEGSLCLECIVFYERIRNDSSLQDVARARASVAAPPGGQDIGQPEAQEQLDALIMLRRDLAARRASQASESSASWSLGVGAALVPPPPSSYLASLQQHGPHPAQLPQIVTTVCEDLSERSSLDAAAAAAAQAQDASCMHFSEIGQTAWGQHGSTRAEMDRQTVAESCSQEVEFNMGSRHSISGSKMSCGHAPSSETGHLASCSQSSGSGGRVSRSKSRDTNDYEPSAAHSLARPSTAMMARGSSSDPGHMNEQARRGEPRASQEHPRVDYSSGAESSQQERESRGPRSRRRHAGRHQDAWRDQTSDEGSRSGEDEALFSERGASPQSSGRAVDGPTSLSEQASSVHGTKRTRRMGSEQTRSGQLDTRRHRFGSRQRSLSLSNSNLITLPNATGMLADVLVSVLFGGAPATPANDEQEARERARKQKNGKK